MPILSAEEAAAIEELRLRLKNELSPEQFNDENMFYRFLTARDFKVDLAEAMLRKHLVWSKAHQLDTFLIDYKVPEVIEKYFSHNNLGYDKDDCPIIYVSLGTMHYESILKSLKESEIYKFYIWTLESNIHAANKRNEKIRNDVYQATIIFDVRELSFSTATSTKHLGLLMMFILMTNANYPERLKVLYFINAPVCFKIAYTFLRPFVPDGVFKKIRFFGSDGWKESLLQLIDADVLPAFLGGQRTDPDGNPFCNTFVVHGSKVPEKYYMCNCRKPMYKRADSTKLLIPAFSKEQVRVNVTQYDHALEWEYETKHGDIGFGLFYQENCDDVSNIEELIPVEKVHSCDGSERGMFRCLKPGTYILLFDNSYSYFYQKEVYFKVISRKLNSKN